LAALGGSRWRGAGLGGFGFCQGAIDLVVTEIRLVLTEAELAKPPADIDGRASHG
jgi:hypothetical protein